MNKLEARASALRRDMTKEERRLWFQFLRERPEKWNCQKVFAPYIVDFYCESAALCVEVDGSQHYEPDAIAYDQRRTKYLESLGLKVLRFTNHDIRKNLEGVCYLIDREVNMAKSVLGKGMNALIDDFAKENVSRETSSLRISLIEPNRDQPRKNFDEDALTELADSIRKYGVLQPLIVEKNGSMYQIVAGERRWRAAKLAGLTEVPVIIREFGRSEAAEVALIENLQREDLNPVEEAFAYKALIEEFGVRQEDVAAKVSKSRTAVTNSLRLLKLSDSILGKLSEGKLSAGHARAILSVEDEAMRETLCERIVEEGMSVRTAEKLAKSPALLMNKKAEKKPVDAYLKSAARSLTKSLGTKVSIKPGKDGKGKIVIDYFSEDVLNELIERLK